MNMDYPTVLKVAALVLEEAKLAYNKGDHTASEALADFCLKLQKIGMQGMDKELTEMKAFLDKEAKRVEGESQHEQHKGDGYGQDIEADRMIDEEL